MQGNNQSRFCGDLRFTLRRYLNLYASLISHFGRLVDKSSELEHTTNWLLF